MNTPTVYDKRPYDSKPASATHPDRLYTMARLFGLNPATVASCRVLELGCAEGGNIVPMAVNLPGSEFVGLDLSRVQIEMGRAVQKDLVLKNLRLEHAGITDVNQSWGRFDYIVCHGVYSWVPPEVREKILGICAENLAPDGVAYVDYNTYPGWFVPETVRTLMRFHTAGIQDPETRIDQALAIADFLVRSLPDDDDRARDLRRETENIIRDGRSSARDALFFHEFLEEHNRPCWFHEFAGRLAEYGLQYLGESDFGDMLVNGLPATALDAVRGETDVVRLEQYLDFPRNRRFRRSLLVKAGHQVDRNVNPAEFLNFRVAATAGVTSDLVDQYQASDPARRALKRLLEHRPRSLNLNDLLTGTLADAPGGLDPEKNKLDAAADFIRFWAENMVLPMSWQADFTITPGNRPRLCPLAEYQAAKGWSWLSNQCHEPSRPPGPIMDLARRLNGRRDRSALIGYLAGEIRSGRLTVSTSTEDGRSRPVRKPSRRDLENALDYMLARLAALALLAA